MNKIIITGVLTTFIGLAACQKKDDNNATAAPGQPAPVAINNQTFATTPQPCNAGQTQQVTQNGQTYYYSYTSTGMAPANQTNCNNTAFNNTNWNQQYSYGSWYWPNQWQPQTGYCGCPLGYSPVFNASFGVACAPIAYFNNYVVYYNNNWSQGPAQNTLPLNTPQTQYVGPSTTNSCYNTAAQGCDVRVNTCPGGSVCQPTGGGSTIGLCVRIQ